MIFLARVVSRLFCVGRVLKLARYPPSFLAGDFDLDRLGAAFVLLCLIAVCTSVD